MSRSRSRRKRSHPKRRGSSSSDQPKSASPLGSKSPGPPRVDPIAAATTVDAYFDVLEGWVEREAEAERERMAARRELQSRTDAERGGETLVTMTIVDDQTGLAGRYLFDFAKLDGRPLPMTRLKVGSPVVLSDDDDPADAGIAGVVSRRTADRVQVATDQWPDARRFRIDLSPDETTRRRQLSAIARTRTSTGRTAKLRDSLLGTRPLRFGDEPACEFLTRLNPPQQNAVRFALSAKDVAIIHGPPGTGKTTTLAEVIYQAVRRGDRVLACAASNTGVDNLMQRIVRMLPHVLRVGHPARVFEELRGHTLDELVDADPSGKVIADLRRELESLMRAAQRASVGSGARRKRGEYFAEAGRIRGQIRSIERSVVRGVLDRADVICTTLTIDDDLLSDQAFDLVAIDEACQSTLPGFWQAALRADRMVLAGDHQQLPPTVLSDLAAAEGMKRSMMERLIDREGDSSFRRLTVQYRMNDSIMRFPSGHFYDDELVADASVKSHRLHELEGVDDSLTGDPPVQWIDTAGAGYDETLERDGMSKLNQQEAVKVFEVVRRWVEAGVPPGEIAVIAPYAAQVRWLRNRITDRAIEIDTVDGFQGREKEAVVLTMVRSNPTGEIGFLSDRRRTNVAITRARRAVVIIGDSATLARHPFYEALLADVEAGGGYRSVWESF